MKSKINLGILLILIGGIGILSSFITINENFVLSGLAITLIILYFVSGGNKNSKNTKYIFGASMLTVAQSIDYLENHNLYTNFQGTIFFSLMAIAFAVIYFVHSFWQKEGSNRRKYSPAVASLICIFIAILTFSVEGYHWNFANILLNNGWPIILVIMGTLLIVKNYKCKVNKN